VVGVADNWNQAYYGRTVTPPDILMTARAHNPNADQGGMQSAARPAAPRQVCVDASHAPAIAAAQVTEAARSFGFEPLCLDGRAGELARPGR